MNRLLPSSRLQTPRNRKRYGIISVLGGFWEIEHGLMKGSGIEKPA